MHRFDVTESQIIIIICQLLTGTLGPWFWNFTVTARIFMLSNEQWRELNKDGTFVMHRIIKKQKFKSLPGGISQTNRSLENK